jgi:phage major head subunit gpT-like protein
MTMAGIAGGIRLEAAVTAYFTAADTVFKNGGLTPLGSLICERRPCNGTSFEVDALGPTPAVQQILGDRRWANLRAYVNHVAVSKYGPDGLTFNIIDIENDPTGMVSQKLSDYLSGNGDWLEKPLWDFIFGNPTCIDTSALFATTHGYGALGATWSNKSTNALSPAEFFTGISGMAALVYENGEPAGYYPKTLMVGPSNEKMADDLCGSDRVVPIAATGLEAYASAVAAATKSNFMSGRMKVVINPRMIGTYDDYWYLLDTGRPGAPPIYVGDAQPMKAFAVTAPESPGMIQASKAVFYAEAFAGLMGGIPYGAYAGIL